MIDALTLQALVASRGFAEFSSKWRTRFLIFVADPRTCTIVQDWRNNAAFAHWVLEQEVENPLTEPVAAVANTNVVNMFKYRSM